MRIWHKELITVLPRQQLLGQWRECCLVARNIRDLGKPNHILVDKVMLYDLSHFYNYALLIKKEMQKCGYKCNFNRFTRYWDEDYKCPYIKFEDLFSGWHNDNYLRQCYYNLQEKHDCGGIESNDWNRIVNKYLSIIVDKKEAH